MPDRIEMLREASERATPGPWFRGYGADDELWDGDSESQHKIWPDPHGVGRLIARTGTNFTGWIERDADDAAFIVASANFLRDLLSGTWPDQEAVERAKAAILADHSMDWAARDAEAAAEHFAKLALTAALGLTVLERG